MGSKGTRNTQKNNRNVATHLLMSPVQLMLENDLPVNEALHFVGQGVEGFNQGLDQLGRIDGHDADADANPWRPTCRFHIGPAVLNLKFLPCESATSVVGQRREEMVMC